MTLYINKCTNCNKVIFSYYKEDLHTQSENHMMITGHVVIECLDYKLGK